MMGGIEKGGWGDSKGQSGWVSRSIQVSPMQTHGDWILCILTRTESRAIAKSLSLGITVSCNYKCSGPLTLFTWSSVLYSFCTVWKDSLECPSLRKLHGLPQKHPTPDLSSLPLYSVFSLCSVVSGAIQGLQSMVVSHPATSAPAA